MTDESPVYVRYMVADVADAVAFYVDHLDFTLEMDALPAFAEVSRGALRLLLSGPKTSAARPMSDGAQPGPGGKQALVVDPSGNLVELFQPSRSAG